MPGKEKIIYGFICENKPKNLGSIGIDKEEVHIFTYQDIAAVVSDVPSMQFDSLPKEALLRNLAVYQSVIENVMQDHSIIPMKFGTVVQGDEEVTRTLENGYEQINSSLKKMENKIEIDIAALWSDLETILKEIGEEEEIKTLKKEAVSKPADQTFQIKINVGKLVKESLDNKREECALLILEALKKDAEDHHVHSIMDDSMIMNNAFLIGKDKYKNFEEKVNQLDRYFQNRINFRIVGPLPPYSFSTFEVMKVGFSELNEAREMLGLGKETTPSEIKEAYRDLAKKLHPDKFSGDPEAQKRFEKINKAYHMLSEYCQEGGFSFKEADVKGRIAVRPVEQQGTL